MEQLGNIYYMVYIDFHMVCYGWRQTIFQFVEIGFSFEPNVYLLNAIIFINSFKI